VANMPGAVAQTSTFALTNTTIPYGLRLADHGVVEAAKRDPALALGLNCFNGHVTYKAVADALDLPYTPLEKAFASRR
jgi:alanine dehydrogenase